MSFHSPEGEEALRPPRSDLRSPGRISRLGEYTHFRWEFSQENGERERNDTGESVFPETDPFLYFSGLFIHLFVIHRDEYRVTRGSADLTLVTAGASYKIIQRSYEFHHLLAMRSADILWPLLIPVS